MIGTDLAGTLFSFCITDMIIGDEEEGSLDWSASSAIVTAFALAIGFADTTDGVGQYIACSSSENLRRR